MADLSTQYLGMTLKNPVIAGSSGLTNSVKSIKRLEEGGAGAVVLKSIFEEEIAFEYDDILKEAESKGYDLDQFDYYDYKIKEDNLNKYTALISESKQSVSIPVIASVNCVYSHEWLAFVSQIEKAGADALELNMFFLPSDFERTSAEKEAAYFQIIEKVQKTVKQYQSRDPGFRQFLDHGSQIGEIIADFQRNRYADGILHLFDNLEIGCLFLFAGALKVRRQEKHIQFQGIRPGFFNL